MYLEHGADERNKLMNNNLYKEIDNKLFCREWLSESEVQKLLDNPSI